MSISFTKLGKFSFIIFSNIFSISCSFSSLSGTPDDVSVGVLEVVPEAPYTILVSFGFLFFPSCSSWLGFFCFLMFQTIDLTLSITTLLLISCKLFFISIIVSFNSA